MFRHDTLQVALSCVVDGRLTLRVPHGGCDPMLAATLPRATAAAGNAAVDCSRTVGTAAVAEVHEDVVCDRCGTCPVVGRRYKSLELDNYDLCQACFASRQRDPQMWVQVTAQGWDLEAADDSGAAMMADTSTAVVPMTTQDHMSETLTCTSCGIHPAVSNATSSARSDGASLCGRCLEEQREADDAVDVMPQDEEVCPWVSDDEQLPTAPSENLQQPSPTEKKRTPPEEAPTQEEMVAKTFNSSAGSVNDEAGSQQLLQPLAGEELGLALATLLQHRSSAVREAARAAVVEATRRNLTQSFQPRKSLEDDEQSDEGQAEWTKPEELGATMLPGVLLSAKVMDSAPLLLGIEADEVASSRGDVTEDHPDVLADAGARQAFCIGRIVVAQCSNLQAPIPACAKITILNDGLLPWPETASVVCVAGNDLGISCTALGPAEPGEAAELILDLLVPLAAESKIEASQSAWALIDRASGLPLGPVLLFSTLQPETELQGSSRPTAL